MNDNLYHHKIYKILSSYQTSVINILSSDYKIFAVKLSENLSKTIIKPSYRATTCTMLH